MGCDIHFYVERKTKDHDYYGPKDKVEERDKIIDEIISESNDGIEEKWITCDKWEISDWDDNYWQHDAIYGGRNYQLFSILGGVRGEYTPIAYPRGVPDDCCYPYKHVVEWMGVDGHSHSYYYLNELLEVDWSKYEYWGDSFEWFKKDILEKINKFHDDPEKIRILFFFDN